MVRSSPTCKKTSFSNSALTFSLFDDSVKKVKNSYFFEYFSTKNTPKLFKSNRNRLNSTRAFEWCINCHASAIFDFFVFFGKGPPLCKKWTKIFFWRNMTIYTPFESPCRVQAISVAYKKFQSVFGRKIFEKQ